MSTQAPMQPVMVRMPEDLYDQVKRVAEEEDRSISQMIRKAVKEYVGSNRI